VLTEFQARSGMDLDPAARVLELSAERVAQIGYDALMRGERVAVAGIGNRIAVSLMHLVPNALLLRLVDQRPRALRNKH
jgi:short-subunit dehydrogenase